MINASCMMIHVYILMLNCMSKTIKGQIQILSNCVFYVLISIPSEKTKLFPEP